MSRHFVADYERGELLFGDGRRGMNPPRGKFNIKLASYSAGGGEAGNAAPGTLRILAENIPFIAGCDNPFPAEGGADRESVESLKARAAGILKSRGRAVTAEDFEWLSHEASASVGRAFCLREKNRQGEIRVALIPAAPRGPDSPDRLVPSRELLRRVSCYLDERKLVGTKIRLQGPVYRAFSIFLTLTADTGVLDRERLKKSVVSSLRKTFHPLWGGSGSGWDFGKAVTPGAVLKQLEKTEGLLSADEAALFDIDAGVIVEKLVLKDDELPFLEEVRIEERG
jgi:predicted phage baseplate assembly protein